MENRHVYADYNATTPLRSEVKDAIASDLDIYGNASSLHASGRQARARVEEARKAVGSLLGSDPASIIFTSGGSESNNAVFQTMRQLKSDRNEFVTTQIEHPCVLNSAEFTKEQGFTLHFIPVDEYGKIKMEAFKAALSEKTLFVSVMTANNEIGTIQDIKEIARLAKEAGAYFHTDAVQALARYR
jgi:cysteine desulfurase